MQKGYVRAVPIPRPTSKRLSHSAEAMKALSVAPGALGSAALVKIERNFEDLEKNAPVRPSHILEDAV